ncbi:hypothetical protein ACIRRI_20450 [Streptomyces mirabilis]|uniref:hypothetical protein n=1 Tax=Streptomyces mirabilis TaxID=68239 RepID=UPI0037F4E082
MKSHEATIKHLEAYAKREDEALRGLATTRDSAATKLEAAQMRGQRERVLGRRR